MKTARGCLYATLGALGFLVMAGAMAHAVVAFLCLGWRLVP